jgi:hypothetical protein
LDYVLATPHIINAVEKAGYEAFNARYPTDHRAYFVDFSTDALFGIQIQPLSNYEPRVLKANNVKQVTAYIRAKHKYLEAHNVIERMKRLELPGNRHKFAEKIDKDVEAASLAAEKTIPHFDKPFWSMELAQARRKIQVGKKLLSMAKTRLDNQDVITREWQAAFSSEDDMPQTIRECKELLKVWNQQVNELVKSSYETRENERRRKIEELTSSTFASDHDQANRLRHMQKAEALNQLFAKVRRLRVIQERQGVTRIEIPMDLTDDPKTCDSWRQIDIPTQVLYHLRVRNQKHFGQAQGTPFTVPPLSTDLGFTGQKQATAQLLAGTYQCDLEKHCNLKVLLEHLKQSQAIANMEHTASITADEMKGKLKVWRELTATSPSGLHLGHYKALIANHQYSNKPEDEDDEHKANREELDKMQADLFQLHLHLINYALERGYSYQRWQKVANSILFKEPGNIRIHRTRVIHLYKADYNLAMGLKWRSALYQADSLSLLNDGQYGSRPNRNAIDPVFIEELQFELSRLTRKTLVQTNYDATSCYDRIIPNLAMVESQTFGVPKSVTASNGRTLKRARYHIRTEMGLSEDSYTHSNEHPIFGTGQGSGNSPAKWCFLSSIPGIPSTS